MNADIFPQNFSEYLARLFKQVRQEADLTQEEIAKLLGTSQKVYQRWETGHSEPSGEFAAKIFLLKDYLRERKSDSIKFTTPTEVAKKVLTEIGTQEDIHVVAREMAEPVIVLIKDLLWYANHLTDSGKTILYRPPIYIEWFPNTVSSALTVRLGFDNSENKTTVLQAYNVNFKTNFNEVQIATYHPGQWVSILKRALDMYKSHSHMGIDDSSLLVRMEKAFELDDVDEKL